MNKNIKSIHAVPAVAAWRFPEIFGSLFWVSIGTMTFWFVASRVLQLENHVLTTLPTQVDRQVAFNELVRQCTENQYRQSGVVNSLACRTWANTKIRIYSNL
jgi:hypothetical protein